MIPMTPYTINNIRLVHNTTLDLALCCIAHALTLVATQHDATIDSDSILRSLCCVLASGRKKNWLRTDYFHMS